MERARKSVAGSERPVRRVIFPGHLSRPLPDAPVGSYLDCASTGIAVCGGARHPAEPSGLGSPTDQGRYPLPAWIGSSDSVTGGVRATGLLSRRENLLAQPGQ